MKTYSLLNLQYFSAVFAALVLAAVPSYAGTSYSPLFNGKDLTGWRTPIGNWTAAQAVTLNPADMKTFLIIPGQGILVNGPAGHTVDLVSEREFGDLDLHVEFCIAKQSNSGIYLMGRYELQIYDSFGVAKDQYPGIECGGIYPRWINNQNVEGHSPLVNASKTAGDWQVFDITFRAPRFDGSGRKIANAKLIKVIHNGKVIQENLQLNGPTRGPLAEDEKPTGPIRLQGDHGPVAFRNLWVRSITLN